MDELNTLNQKFIQLANEVTIVPSEETALEELQNSLRKTWRLYQEKAESIKSGLASLQEIQQLESQLSSNLQRFNQADQDIYTKKVQLLKQQQLTANQPAATEDTTVASPKQIEDSKPSTSVAALEQQAVSNPEAAVVVSLLEKITKQYQDILDALRTQIV